MSRFDEVIERRGTGSLKWDAAAERGHAADALPLWVADMDFQVPDAVTEALHARVDHAIYGYSEPGAGYFEAVTGWMERRHGWQVDPAWIVPTPGVVFALAQIVQALTSLGDAVLIAQPVYYPFSEVVVDNGRRLVVTELSLANGRYEMDLADFEAKIVENNVRMFILCSPHNPVGRVWTEAELRAIGEICLRHGVLVIADEIHADLILTGKHTVFAGLTGELAAELAASTITCTAPSKTFNLAGLQVANLVISNPDLRERLKAGIVASGYSQLNPLGLVACEAAYRGGEVWLEELLDYLRGNVALVRDFLAERLPQVKLIEPEGTYLVWLDLRELGLSAEEQRVLIREKAGLWLDEGQMFGPAGLGFERVNVACPRATLLEALERMARVGLRLGVG